MTRTIALILGVLMVSADALALTPAEVEFFEKKVRPILVARCYECHSREGKTKGGLRLDTKEGWVKGGDSGAAIVPGDAGKSRLIRGVRSEDPEVVEMPPKGKLPQEEIDVLVKWVEMGAPDPRVDAAVGQAKGVDVKAGRGHWAYQPIREAKPPVVRDEGWAKTDIDRFVLSGLEGRGLRPSAEADRVTLVRRVYFDLIGLPPTPEQVDRFLADESAGAYERLVDELLASPHFGERWGRHWLDVARFGESLTLRGFVLPGTWRYRDYVIEAFNEDRPFDVFMKEQVSGDLMQASSVEERRRQVTATAFLAMGNINLEEQDKKQLRMDAVDEQLEAIGRAFLAQTIGCARCHDHKFDPIPAKDYYAMAGILRSTRAMEHANVSKWIEAPLPEEPAVEEAITRHEKAVAELQARIKLAKGAKGSPGAVGVVSVAALGGAVADDAQARKVGVWKHSTSVKAYVGEGYVHDDNAGKGSKTITFEPELPRPGKYEVRLAYTTGPTRATNVPVTVFSADGEQTVTVNQREAPPVDGHFVSLGKYSFEKNGQGFVIVSNEGTDGYVVADAVQFVAAEEAGAQRTAGGAGDDLRRMEGDLKELMARGPKREMIVSVREEEAKEIGDTSVHVRGSVHTLGEAAPRGFLSVVPVSRRPAISAKQSGRKELGEWLSDPQNPLPARVMANRVWHWLMGAGIVRTTDNFGTTGEAPSHPELLDYLARRFVEQGWSVKKLVREVVLSRAYRMSSADHAEGLAVDPENRLMWRANRQRLEAECIRDAMLMASGQLKLERGGRTYKEGLTSDYGHRYTDTRRSVYVPVFRNALPELFTAFDFPDPSTPTGRRDVSVVSPQALFFMNNGFVVEQAGKAAERLMGEKRLDERGRVMRAYRWTLGRMPGEGEIEAVVGFVRGAAGEEREKWAQVFQALFASVDFRYVD